MVVMPNNGPALRACCTLKQFYDWLVRWEKSYDDPWANVHEALKRCAEDDCHEYHEQGGEAPLTPVTFHLLDDFAHDHADPHACFTAIAGLFLLPMKLWEYVRLDLDTLKYHMEREGERLYTEWVKEMEQLPR